MTALTTHALTVRRAGRAIVNDASFELRAGMFVAVIGGNGAGKSTLLACLAGLLRPDAGSVNLDDVPLRTIDKRLLARRRAYLPQSRAVEWPISVERLVALGLTPQLPGFGGSVAESDPRLVRALADGGLLEKRLQPATTLSGGELARAMLARALVGEPEIFLADEPAAGLDPKYALETVLRLQRLAAEQGRLVIAAMHEITLAARHASHVLALRDGRVLAFGEIQKTLSPGLLHDVFELDARLVGAGGSVHVDFTGGLTSLG